MWSDLEIQMSVCAVFWKIYPRVMEIMSNIILCIANRTADRKILKEVTIAYDGNLRS
jgi:hypothetical protein